MIKISVVFLCLAAVLVPSLAFAQTSSDGTPPATLTLGGEVILRLYSSVGGQSAQERIDAVTDRLAQLVAVPDLEPADVVVYEPPKEQPAIYALGRRLLTVDAPTAAAYGQDASVLAVRWARHLQQVLPLVDIRRSSEPEPTVPSNPPLAVVKRLDETGGEIGDVILNDKLVFQIFASPLRAQTPAEYADYLSAHLTRVVNRPSGAGAEPATAQGGATSATLLVHGEPVMEISADLAAKNNVDSALALAQVWAQDINALLSNQSAPEDEL